MIRYVSCYALFLSSLLHASQSTVYVGTPPRVLTYHKRFIVRNEPIYSGNWNQDKIYFTQLLLLRAQQLDGKFHLWGKPWGSDIGNSPTKIYKKEMKNAIT